MYDAMRRSKVVFALLLIAASSSRAQGRIEPYVIGARDLLLSGATGELREEALRVLTTVKANGPAPFAPV